MKNKKIEKHSLKNINYINKILQSKASLIILLLVLIIFFVLSKINAAVKKTRIEKEILPKAIKKILRDENAKFTISNLKEKSDLFEFQLTWNNQTYPPSYITKDGSMLFTSAGIDVKSLLNPQPSTANEPKKLSCEEIKKVDSPKMTAFIVSNCPYGLHAQRVFKKAIEELPELSSYLNIKYIGDIQNNQITSMHGDEEAKENLRQICIREEQSDLYWPYVSCYMKKENNSENCLSEVGIDTVSLNECMNDKNRGLKYAKNDFDLAKKFNIGGSPTFLINNQQIITLETLAERNPNNIKENLCCAFNKKPDFCKKELFKDQLAISFSETDEQVAGTSTGGSCNN